MKRILSFAAVILLLSGGIIGVWYWPRLRGAGPALLPPAPLIEKPSGGLDDSKEIENEVALAVQDGYAVTIFARNLADVRDLQPIDDGYLVSIPSRGQVVALVDADRNGKADATEVVLSGLNRPHGLALSCPEDACTLYVAETTVLASYQYNPATRKATQREELVSLPAGGRHTTRSLLIAPAERFGENRLLVSIGSSCDVCAEKDSRLATVMILKLEKPYVLQPLARGLRNAVFLAEHPISHEVWVTEMGRDHLGDNLPPDEINILTGEEQNFGWPICYGRNIHDTNFDKNTYIRNPCLEPFEVPAAIELPAHSAPLGLAFGTGNAWAGNSLFVAYHGSWNRTVPTGYKIVRFELDSEGKSTGEFEDFASGWLAGSRSTGRPVDIATTASGELFASDDKAGLVYRFVPQKTK